MKSFFLSLALLLLCAACADNASEPCEWNQNRFKAKVERIEFNEINAQGDSIFTVWVDFSAGSLSKELQDLGKLRGIEFTKEKLELNSAKVGLSYTGTISDLESGSCESPIVSFDQKLR